MTAGRRLDDASPPVDDAPARPTLGLTRRQLIAGTAGLGFLGAATGVSTASYLSDREFFAGVLTAGEVDLQVVCADDDDACDADGGTVRLALGGVVGQCGSTGLCLTVTDNPVWVWLRTSAPSADVGVADVVWVELRYADGTPVRDAAGDPVSGTLREIQAQLASGIRLDADPSTPDVDPLAPDDRLCLELEWGVAEVGGGVDVACPEVVGPDVLDEDGRTDAVELDSLAWELEFFGGQYRHDADPASPWDPVLLEDAALSAPCLGCRFLGKYELPGGRQVMEVGESYVLEDCDGADTPYAILVHEAADKDGGSETYGLRSFSLIRADTAVDDDPTPGPKICRIDVKGGGGRAGGCPPAPTPDDGTRVYEVCPPTADVTGEFDAPTKDQKKKTVQTAISYVAVYVCGGGPPECL